MIRVSQLKLSTSYTEAELRAALEKKLRIRPEAIGKVCVVRQSLDARGKANIHYSVTVDAEASQEKNIYKRLKNDRSVMPAPDENYEFVQPGYRTLTGRMYVAGSGPAGLFCAYMLAKAGYRPVLIERGSDADTRREKVRAFHEGRAALDPECNVQFGEGGAGTFSDGKLNCSIKDKTGRSTFVLRTFVSHGAKKEITYTARPHVGTDVLTGIVKSMREEIISLGGEVRFDTALTGIETEDGCLRRIRLRTAGPVPGRICRHDDAGAGSETGCKNEYTEPCGLLVLATGHSARDTFRMLYDAGLEMEAKAFAVGVRAEHLQEDINTAQYGEYYKEKYKKLPPADYKLTGHTVSGRSVFSFCMCPGGYVINSSSEEGGLCVNGMSYSGRSGENANAAIIVNVTPADTGAERLILADDRLPGSISDAVPDIFAGVRFQEELERLAFEACGGKIPTQRLEDFFAGRPSDHFGRVKPQHKGESAFADLNTILPDFIADSIKETMPGFAAKIKGYDDGDVLLSAVESRTSSPLRILRGSDLQSNIEGIYPCGEGAGYAGGIMSAAMDGIRVSEEIIRKFARPDLS